jgi:hypothetical protein
MLKNVNKKTDYNLEKLKSKEYEKLWITNRFFMNTSLPTRW